MRLVAMSRKFPPDFKRKWYIMEEKGIFLIKYVKPNEWSFDIAKSLNEALNLIGVK
jgi:hypothetical protein